MMHLLEKPRDLDEQIRQISKRKPEERLPALASLANYRLDFIDTMQLDRLLGKPPVPAAAGFMEVRLAVLASHTTQHLSPAIRVAGLRRRLLIDTYASQYGQFRQDILVPSSGLYKFCPDVVLLAVSAGELLTDMDISADLRTVEMLLAGKVDEIRALWRAVRDRTGAGIVQQTVLDVSEPLFGSLDRMVPGAPSRALRRFNDLLADAATKDGARLLDIEAACLRDGRDNWFDTPRWLQGKYEIAPHAAPAFGELLTNIIAAECGRSRKCLVLDLDNTLWGGVLGEDGIAGIALGQGDPLGEAFQTMQAYALQLKNRGIVLAVCSKNDPDLVTRAFDQHPDMVLQRDDFAMVLANWTDKSANIRAIAEQLNIGLDSLVFVDDNPAERQRIRASLPMVAVPELPEDPADYARCIARAGYFEAVTFTSEDRERAEQYRVQGKRAALQESAQSMDEFLASLDMQLTYGEAAPADLPRAAQLLAKTNQFNMTNRRPTLAQLEDMIDTGRVFVRVFRLADRFGDNGLVSVVLLEAAHDHPAQAEIVNWVMSCRVFGRELEHEIMNIVVELARNRSWGSISADFIASDRNAVVESLYECLGFCRIDSAEAGPSTTRWLLNANGYQARKTHITRGSEQ